MTILWMRNRAPGTGRTLSAVYLMVAALAIATWNGGMVMTLSNTGRGSDAVMWGGFDIALCVVAGSTAISIAVGSPAARSWAVCLATMLLCDVWFDVNLAPAQNQVASLTMGLGLTVPFALSCLIISGRLSASSATTPSHSIASRHSSDERSVVPERKSA